MEENTHTNKTNWWSIAIPVIVLIAVASFIGGSLIQKQKKASTGNLTIDRSQPEEMPQTEPTIYGMVKETDGDTLIVSEFNINETMGIVGDGGVLVGVIKKGDDENSEDSESLPTFIGDDGVSVEVVITKNTKVYKDISIDGNTKVMQSGEMPEIADMAELAEDFVMKIEPGIIEEIGPSSFITVWGEKTGDRIIADFILYQAPLNFGGFEFEEN